MKNTITDQIGEKIHQYGSLSSDELSNALRGFEFPPQIQQLCQQAIISFQSFEQEVEQRYRPAYDELVRKRGDSSLPSLHSIIITMGLSDEFKAERLHALLGDQQIGDVDALIPMIQQIHEGHEEHQIAPFELGNHPQIMRQDIQIIQDALGVSRDQAKHIFQIGADHGIFGLDSSIKQLKDMMTVPDNMRLLTPSQIKGQIFPSTLILFSSMRAGFIASEKLGQRGPILMIIVCVLLLASSYKYDFNESKKRIEKVEKKYDTAYITDRINIFDNMLTGLLNKSKHIDAIRSDLNIVYDDTLSRDLGIKSIDDLCLYLSEPELEQVRSTKKIDQQMIDNIRTRKDLLEKVQRVGNNKIYDIVEGYIQSAELGTDIGDDFSEIKMIAQAINPQFNEYDRQDMQTILDMLSIFMRSDESDDYSDLLNHAGDDDTLDLYDQSTELLKQGNDSHIGEVDV